MPHSKKKFASKRAVHLRLRQHIYEQLQTLADSEKTADWPDGMPLATYLVSVIEPLIARKYKALEDSQGD